MTGLWRGLSPTLLMAVPATALYFTVYEELKVSRLHLQWFLFSLSLADRLPLLIAKVSASS